MRTVGIVKFRSIARLLCYGLMLAALFVIHAYGQYGDRAPRISNPDLPIEPAEDTKRPDPIYDKVKNETTSFLSGVMVVSMDSGRRVYIASEGQNKTLPSGIIKMVVYYKFTGKSTVKPDRVVLAFEAGNSYTFLFTNDRDLKIKLPDESLNLGKLDLTGRRKNGPTVYAFLQYWETMETTIPAETYKKIINAKSVSMQIGGSSAALTEAQLKLLRNVASKYLN